MISAAHNATEMITRQHYLLAGFTALMNMLGLIIGTRLAYWRGRRHERTSWLRDGAERRDPDSQTRPRS
jgi:hypothetical protein